MDLKQAFTLVSLAGFVTFLYLFGKVQINDVMVIHPGMSQGQDYHHTTEGKFHKFDLKIINFLKLLSPISHFILGVKL